MKEEERGSGSSVAGFAVGKTAYSPPSPRESFTHIAVSYALVACRRLGCEEYHCLICYFRGVFNNRKGMTLFLLPLGLFSR